jgi:regulator of sigma E protease
LPLGGYVKMLDERESPVPAAERHRAFNNRPVPHRIAVLLAGPGFNFLFAIFAYWVMFVTGVPGIKPYIGAVTEGSVAATAGLRAEDEIQAVGGRSTQTWEHATLAILDERLADGQLALTVLGADGRIRNVMLDVRGRVGELTEPNALFSGLGIRPGPVLPAEIGAVTAGEAADRAGLTVGDRVLRVNDTDVRSFEDWARFIRQRPGETVSMLVAREGRQVELTVTIDEVEENGATVGRIWASPPTRFPPELIERLSTEQRYGVFAAVGRGIDKTWEMSALTVRMLARMVVGDVSMRNISGPISIAGYAGDSAQAGPSTFLSFLAIVSISLAILNLLPVPLLDGGQVVYQLAEWIKGAPLSERVMVVGQQLGMLFLIVLMTFVFYNDLTRVFS